MADDLQFTNNANDFGSVIGSNPAFGLHTSDILHSSQSDGSGGDSSSFTGIGDLGLDFSAPTVVGVSSSSEQHDFSSGGDQSGSGGLLGGLL